MTTLMLIGSGFRVARRHPRMVLITYLTSLLPALLLVGMARSSLAPAFDSSLFASSVLDGRWVGPWSDFSASPANTVSDLLGSGLVLALLLTALVQVVVSAGMIEVLLERTEPGEHPFASGVARHTWPFVRSGVWFLVLAALAGGAALGTLLAFFKLAETYGDGRLDMVGIGAAGALALLLMAVLSPAYDLARIALARFGDRSTVRGFPRGIWLVLRRPGVFIPLFLSYVTLIVALHLGYYGVRSPWTAGTAVAILVLLVAQQLLMLVRAFLHVAFRGAEITAYRLVGEPRLGERRHRARKTAETRVPEQPTGTGVEREPEPVEPASEVVVPVTDPGAILGSLERPDNARA